MNTTKLPYSALEEKWNVYSHSLGFILGIPALVLLLIKAIKLENTLAFTVYLVYGLCILTLFAASSLYHKEIDLDRRKKLKVFDHSAIYLLIAGSYLPFIALGMANKWGYGILIVVWLLAIAGIVLKLFFTGRFKLLSTISYVLLGWIVVIIIKPLMNALSGEALSLLAVGGLFYTLGAVLYSIKKIPFNHAIFHVFVLIAAFSHFLAIYLYI
ncbi:PAQR family membrane homeostasis protein TrhA [Carboxylicivirga sp. N1Y90]|uniref:PAQR family membrane homeostasis protein TrhA n=1 Tax=Carboxylicivirga fragile TaxID=3417571 RepID=UPI003D34202F|nr:hemolysin III family protein [Marinilabiliaceae bacterium N1Y90]